MATSEHTHVVLPLPRYLTNLVKEPGRVYIAFSLKEIYVSDSKGQVHMYSGPDWKHMSDDEISAWLAAHPLEDES